MIRETWIMNENFVSREIERILTIVSIQVNKSGSDGDSTL